MRTKMRIPPSRFWVPRCPCSTVLWAPRCPCSAVFVPSPLHTLRCSPAHTHFGTRSPLRSTTFWQRGLSSLARPIRPAPPGAAKAAEFRCSSTRSNRCLNCAGVSERRGHTNTWSRKTEPTWSLRGAYEEPTRILRGSDEDPTRNL